jgi:hypothetical protein
LCVYVFVRKKKCWIVDCTSKKKNDGKRRVYACIVSVGTNKKGRQVVKKKRGWKKNKRREYYYFRILFLFSISPFFFNISLSSFFSYHSLSLHPYHLHSLFYFSFLTAISDFSPFPMTHTPSSSTSIFLILKILKGDSVRNKSETTPSLYLSSLSFFFSHSLSLTLSVPSFLRLFELSSRPRIEFCTFSSWSFFFCTKEKKTERKTYKHNLTSKESSETLEKSGGKKRERREKKKE